MRTQLLLASAVLAACGPARPSAEHATPRAAAESPARYTIRIDRAERAGQRWRLRAIGRESRARAVLVRGTAVERSEEAVTVELTALVEVLEVDGAGRQRSMSYTIERLERSVDGQSLASVLDPGRVVTVLRGAEPVVEIDGAPADPAIVEVLDVVLELDEDRDDDLVFGSRVPRAVGESWAADPDAMRHTLPDVVARAAMHGTVRVEDHVEAQGQPCLRLSGHLTIEGLEMPGLPPDASARSQMHTQFEGTFPIDTDRHELDERVKIATTIEVRVEEREVRSRDTREVRRSFEALADR